jgi:quercetin dioxygenase-like cupin family protein
MTYWDELYRQSQLVEVDEQAMVATQFNEQLSAFAMVDSVDAKWVASPVKGVLRLLLERDGGEKTTRATSLVAYQPNSQFSPHAHPRGEEFLVLSGMFSDEHGDYAAGSYVRNPPGSSHQPFSREGCLIFVKLQQFDLQDDLHVVDTHIVDITGVEGSYGREQVLFDGYEQVSFLNVDQPTSLPSDYIEKGVELLVLSGSIVLDDVECGVGAWARLPPLGSRQVVVNAGAQLWVKVGHLSGVTDNG